MIPFRRMLLASSVALSVGLVVACGGGRRAAPRADEPDPAPKPVQAQQPVRPAPPVVRPPEDNEPNEDRPLPAAAPPAPKDPTELARASLVGRWRIGATEGTFDMTLNADRTASKTNDPTATGAWEVVEGEAWVIWSDGWRNKIRPQKGVTVAFRPGTGWNDPPTSTVSAIKQEAGEPTGGGDAYGRFAEPWRTRFVQAWQQERDRWRQRAVAGDVKLGQAEAALVAAKGGVEKAKKDKQRLFGEAPYKRLENAVKAAEEAERKAAAAVAQAQTELADAKRRAGELEKNDPPYLEPLFAGCQTTADVERRVAAKKAEEEYEAGGLVLLKKTVVGTSNGNVFEVTGTVVNRTGRVVRFAKVTYNVYDKNGARIDDATAVISNLEVGGRWAFKAVTLVSGGDTFKLADLSHR